MNFLNFNPFFILTYFNFLIFILFFNFLKKFLKFLSHFLFCAKKLKFFVGGTFEHRIESNLRKIATSVLFSKKNPKLCIGNNIELKKISLKK